ncbi:MAG: TetR/AcrR family transcriptional regulator [Candidatus Omnitrophota bacterium]|jgi:AcrR family transcriptional regulator
MSQTANRHSLRQQEIIESARRIITSRGIENLTIREIAKDLRITDGAIYRHFKSKKEIISLLIDDIEKVLLNAIASAAEKTKEPLGKLENILSSHISYAEQRKGISFIVINETLNFQDKSLRRKMFGVIHRYLKKIKEILSEGIKSGALRKDADIVSASVIFFGMVQSIVTLWALSGFKYSFMKSRVQNLFDIYKKGVMTK